MSQDEKKPNTMLVRSISGAVIVVVMMALIWAGGIVTTTGLAVISCIAYTELLAACGVREAGAKKPCVFDVFFIDVAHDPDVVVFVDQKVFLFQAVQGMSHPIIHSRQLQGAVALYNLGTAVQLEGMRQ